MIPPLLTTQDFARMIGRSPNTLITWKTRGQHDVPQPTLHLGPAGEGAPVWSLECVQQWCAEHQELLRE